MTLCLILIVFVNVLFLARLLILNNQNGLPMDIWFWVAANIGLVLLLVQQGWHVARKIVSNHHQAKRQLEENHLENERLSFEVEKLATAVKANEKSIEEKNKTIDGFSKQIIELLNNLQPRIDGDLEAEIDHIRRFADDLAWLNLLSSQKPETHSEQVDFIELINTLAEHHSNVVIENSEEQILLEGFSHLINDLVRRILLVIVPLSKKLTIRLICYNHAQMGESVQISFDFKGRGLNDQEYERVFEDFIEITHKGEQIGPGYSLKVAHQQCRCLMGELVLSPAHNNKSLWQLTLPLRLNDINEE